MTGVYTESNIGTTVRHVVYKTMRKFPLIVSFQVNGSLGAYPRHGNFSD